MYKNKQRFKKFSGIRVASMTFLSAALIACGGGGGQTNDGKVESDALLKGQFVDSPVSNIAYRTESQSGFTNLEGEFVYRAGENVTFSIGGISLPTTLAKGVLTPLDLLGTANISNVSVINIARLLQSIDRDSNPENGIQIDDQAHTYAEGMDFSFESIEFEDNPNVMNLVANSGSINTLLVSAEAAQAHLQNSLDELDNAPVEDNTAPSVSAGSDQVVEEQTRVTLTGAATDSDGTVVTYAWIQTSGEEVSLVDPETPSVSFVAPALTEPRTLVFELLVVDDNGAISIDTVQVTVNPVNAEPTANAGADQVVDEQTLVTLSGAATDIDGTIASYVWSQVSGAEVTLNDSSSASATFNAPVSKEQRRLVFQLLVTDDEGATNVDSVEVRVNPVNAGPLANGGPDQIVDEQTLVSLTGVGVDTDGTIESYVWSQVSGAEVTLNDSSSASATFNAPVSKEQRTLVFQLLVTDDEGGTNVDAVQITINPVNVAPSVNAGLDQTVDEQTLVTLSGTATDTDGTIVSYAWAQSSGTEVSLIDSNTSVASFLAPDITEDQNLVFSLVVTDDEEASSADSIAVFVKAAPVLSNVAVTVSNPVDSVVDETRPSPKTSATVYKTTATIIYKNKPKRIDLTSIDERTWTGVLSEVPIDVPVTLHTVSADFAGGSVYAQSRDVTLSGQALVVEQEAVLPENIVEEPIDLCLNYIDAKGNIYPLESYETTNGDYNTLIWGYRKNGAFTRHNECGPAYVEHYQSGRKFRDIYYLNGVQYNSGDISYISYYDSLGYDGLPAKNEELRNDETGNPFLLDDLPSRVTYHPSGRVMYKTWQSGADNLKLREVGPDQIYYADNDDGRYDLIWWYSNDQLKQKRIQYYEDGTPNYCTYYDELGENFEVSDFECENELALDIEYNIDGNIEPIDVCHNFIDEDGTVYPVTEQTDNGYLTTGYTKNGQYTYHNSCKAAMSRFYSSGNLEHEWVFINGVNTNPEGFTSISYYDQLDAENKPIKSLESKIEDGFYVIENDKPSVVKYFLNGDVKYKAWMLTTETGEWVYGRTQGPDIVNYTHGNNGYQKKDAYWFNTQGIRLKRKYFDDNGDIDFCSYYQGDDVETDNQCENEEALDSQYEIL